MHIYIYIYLYAVWYTPKPQSDIPRNPSLISAGSKGLSGVQGFGFVRLVVESFSGFSGLGFVGLRVSKAYG